MADMKIHDISLALHGALPGWPGDPPYRAQYLRSLAAGDRCDLTYLRLTAHAGTHVDAPAHYVPGGATVEAMDLDALVGPAVVAAFDEPRHVTARDLDRAGIGLGVERLLIRTRNSDLWRDPGHAFQEDFLALAPDAAQWIVDRSIRLVGVDYLSVEPFHGEGHQVHTVLLGAGVVVVEGLDLSAIEPGRYTLACLPLKLAGVEGAPARAVLFEEE